MSVELDPRVRRFQEIKARRKAEKIQEVNTIAKIKTTNPALSDKQARQVYEASEAQKARITRMVYHGRAIQVTRI